MAFGDGKQPLNFSKQQILTAMSKTGSNRAAASYLNTTLNTYKKYAVTFKDEATGLNLYDLHKNQSGKGIPKFVLTPSALSKRTDEQNKHFPMLHREAVIKLVNGGNLHFHFKPKKVQAAILAHGLVDEVCASCQFEERRSIDNKAPLLFRFKDGDKSNYMLENVEMLCYNCYFLRVGDVFTKDQELFIEDYDSKLPAKDKPEWQLDEYHLKRMKELGLMDEDDEEDDVPNVLGYNEK